MAFKRSGVQIPYPPPYLTMTLKVCLPVNSSKQRYSSVGEGIFAHPFGRWGCVSPKATHRSAVSVRILFVMSSAFFQ